MSGKAINKITIKYKLSVPHPNDTEELARLEVVLQNGLGGYIILERRVAMNGRLHSRHQMGVKVSDAIWTIICSKYFHVG